MGAAGFIIDTPNIAITGENSVYQCLTSQSGEVSFEGEGTSITGGWSFYDLANIDGKKSINVNITNAKFETDQMLLQSGGEEVSAPVPIPKFGEDYVVTAQGEPDNKYVITIPHEVIAGSVRINGMTETTDAVTAQTFKVTAGSGSTTIEFSAEMENKVVSPFYKIMSGSNATTISVRTDDVTKSGEVSIVFPIYGDGDSEKSSEIVGYGYLTIFKGKISSTRTFGGSYKTPSTFTLAISALDPRRPDKKFYDFTYDLIA